MPFEVDIGVKNVENPTATVSASSAVREAGSFARATPRALRGGVHGWPTGVPDNTAQKFIGLRMSLSTAPTRVWATPPMAVSTSAARRYSAASTSATGLRRSSHSGMAQASNVEAMPSLSAPVVLPCFCSSVSSAANDASRSAAAALRSCATSSGCCAAIESGCPRCPATRAGFVYSLAEPRRAAPCCTVRETPAGFCTWVMWFTLGSAATDADCAASGAGVPTRHRESPPRAREARSLKGRKSH